MFHHHATCAASAHQLKPRVLMLLQRLGFIAWGNSVSLGYTLWLQSCTEAATIGGEAKATTANTKSQAELTVSPFIAAYDVP